MPRTPVPAPGGGNVDQTVAAGTIATSAAPEPTRQVSLGSDLSAQLTDAKRIDGKGKGPGEVGGPALQATVMLRNGGAAPLELSNLQITAQDAAGAPAPGLTGEPAQPFIGQLAPGASATGVLVFQLPTAFRAPLQIAVGYGTGTVVRLDVRT